VLNKVGDFNNFPSAELWEGGAIKRRVVVRVGISMAELVKGKVWFSEEKTKRGKGTGCGVECAMKKDFARVREVKENGQKKARNGGSGRKNG